MAFAWDCAVSASKMYQEAAGDLGKGEVRTSSIGHHICTKAFQVQSSTVGLLATRLYDGRLAFSALHVYEPPPHGNPPHRANMMHSPGSGVIHMGAE